MVRQGEADTSLSPHVSEESNKSITAALLCTALLCTAVYSQSAIKEYLEIKIYFLVQLTVTLIDYSALSVCFRSNPVFIIINLTEKNQIGK